VITAVSGDGTTITAALAGGTDNDWDTNDVYRIVWPYASGYGGYADHPWVETFTFELPAGCTSYSVKALNAAATGTMFVHQLEVYANLITNPSLETGAGNPWIPTGWTNDGLDAGDSQASSTGAAIIHSGSDALQYNTGAIWPEGIYQAVGSTPNGSYYTIGYWVYRSGTGWIRRYVYDALQKNLGGTWDELYPGLERWRHYSAVGRVVTSGSGRCTIYSIDVNNKYVDDVYAFALTAVSLTVTPASEANSAESGGIRVDGCDSCTQPVLAGYISPGSYYLQWKMRMRHAPADLLAFLETTDVYAMYLFGDATNYVSLRPTAANTYTLEFNDGGGVHSVNWNCAGAWVADAELRFRIIGRPTATFLMVNNTVVATINQPLSFVTLPTLVYWGSNNSGARQLDAVFLDP